MMFEYSPDTSQPVYSSWRRADYADQEGEQPYYHFWGLEKDFAVDSISRVHALFAGIVICGEHKPNLIPIMPIEDCRDR